MFKLPCEATLLKDMTVYCPAKERYFIFSKNTKINLHFQHRQLAYFKASDIKTGIDFWVQEGSFTLTSYRFTLTTLEFAIYV